MKQRQQIERLKGLRDTAAREMQSSAGNMRSTRQQDDEHQAQLEKLFDKYKQKLARLEQDCLQVTIEKLLSFNNLMFVLVSFSANEIFVGID